MNVTNLLKLALRALLRNKMRSFLTMLGIIIGVGSVIAMLAIGEGSKASIREEMSGMGTNLVMVMPNMQVTPVHQKCKSLFLVNGLPSCRSICVCTSMMKVHGAGCSNW